MITISDASVKRFVQPLSTGCEQPESARSEPPRMSFAAWLMDLLASDMTNSEKLVTIAAVLLQTASNDAISNACRIDRRTVIRSKAAPVKQGWLHIHGVDGGGRGNAPAFRPGHPRCGSGVVFVHSEDAKEGQIATLLFSKEWQNATLCGQKEGHDATLSADKEGRNATLSRDKGGRNTTLSDKEGQDATLSAVKGGENARKGGAKEGQIAPVSRARIGARAQMESLRDSYTLEVKTPPHTPQAPAERVEPKACVGEVLGPNEEFAGHGVVVNCQTIRHAEFSISLPAIELGALGAGMAADDIKRHCLAHALQWAAEIEGGKKPRDVVPAKIANFLCASLMGAKNRADVQDQRMKRAAAPHAQAVAPSATGESRLQKIERQVAAARARLGA